MAKIGFHLIARCDRKDVSIKMNGTTLVFRIWKDFRNGFQHPQTLIPYNEADTLQTAAFGLRRILSSLHDPLHSFGSTYDFTAAILIYANHNQDRDILNFATPATLQVNAINIDVGIFSFQCSGTPCFNMFIRFFVEVTDRTGRNFRSPESFL